jgi:putative ATPase
MEMETPERSDEGGDLFGDRRQGEQPDVGKSRARRGTGPLDSDSSDDQGDEQGRPLAPLAERMRPRSWDEVLGQEHLTGAEAPLRVLYARERLASMILWGPPGSGKTTLAALLSQLPGYAAEQFSAVLSGVKNVREVVVRARERWDREKIRTVLFVDEIHRFNRAQQDAFLPHVESGRIVLIGATTENPSFEVIPPLLSRCAVYVLKPLREEHLRSLGMRALVDSERGLGATPMILSDAAWDVLLRHAALDARRLLNTLEMLASATPPEMDQVRRPDSAWTARVCERQTGLPLGREEHFDIISALHKSLRGSDPHASLYWLARMLESGEDPRYVVRRLIRFASEDVGLADPAALHHANAAAAAYQFVGSPEGHLALAQLTLYLAMCPKSNSVYASYGRAAAMATELGPLGVPLRIRNAPTDLMSNLGYGEGYRYPHASPGHWIAESYLPDGIPAGQRALYLPSDQGREPDLVKAHRRRTRGFYDAAAPDSGSSGSEPESGETGGEP